jgi:hypothetical protein
MNGGVVPEQQPPSAGTPGIAFLRVSLVLRGSALYSGVETRRQKNTEKKKK